MLNGEIASEALLGDFKLSRDVSVREEAESHDDIQDGLQIDFAETGDINCLTVVTQPVAKVHLPLARRGHQLTLLTSSGVNLVPRERKPPPAALNKVAMISGY